MAKKTIMLACGTGMSTSMLYSKIHKIVENEHLDLEVIACSVAEARQLLKEKTVDVLLLGPQVAYLAKKIQEKLADKNTIVAAINRDDYGLANGRKILEQAQALLSE